MPTSNRDLPWNEDADKTTETNTEPLVRARAFPKYPHALPCFHPTDGLTNVTWLDGKVQHSSTTTGLLFVKLLKTASSTGASVAIRVAQKLAQRVQPSYPACQCRFVHGEARMFKYRRRDREKSFLWSMIREPTVRYFSEFFHFEHSRYGYPATDAKIIEFLKDGRHSNHHLIAWLHTRPDKGLYNVSSNIVEDYDFLGLAERMDESLVALKMILDIPLADVLYVSAKTSGGYDDGGYKGRCVQIQKSFVSPAVQAYLASEEWKAYIRPELELYKAVNRSLDLTIDELGRDVFDEHLRKFRAAMQRISEVCGPSIKLPCTRDGIKRIANETDCIWGDSGCGFVCLDRVAAELDLSSRRG